MGQYPFILRLCQQCGATFYVFPARLRQGPARYCSRACDTIVKRAAQETVFWQRVALCEHGRDCPYCCWPWLGFTHRGYGSITKRKRPYPAHRRAWEYWHHREMPAHLEACHYCHTRICVNPAHIHPGTRQENMTESVVAQRMQRGEQRPTAKLTLVDVQHIRGLASQGARRSVLAKQFGVSVSVIRNVLLRLTWKHVP